MDQTYTPTGSVVVGFDGSPAAAQAVAWAAALAEDRHRSLVLLHAVTSTEADPVVGLATGDSDPAPMLAGWTTAGEQMVHSARADLVARHPGLDVRAVVRTGAPRQVLLDAAREGATTLVVGSRGRGPIRSLLLGSVSAAVARHATCPVVVVRPHHPGQVGRGVLVGVDANPDSLVVAQAAFQIASDQSQPLHVLHVLGGGLGSSALGYAAALDQTEVQDAQRHVSEALKGLGEKYPDVHVRVDIAEGSPWQVLIERSAAMSMLVVGRHERGPLSSGLHGSNTLSVVEHTSCPVLVVPVDPVS